jgi:oxepin-CoA hydrolase/3-oxo-5,6-dehydrosuberyl-CoA semialdehyde dehydrogenase
MTETLRIRSYVQDQWVDGEGEGSRLYNPSTGAVVATASTTGVDMGAALVHARRVGGASLRALTFAERGAILKGLSKVVREHRDELLELARVNGGNTAGDGSFDIDGASGTLFFYSNIGRGLGDTRILADGDALPLGKETSLCGRHFWAPRRGAAVLVNAFNFPAWGFAEKMACALMAGMPVVVKPATLTAAVTHRLAELFVDSGLLPPGSWTFLAGPAGDLLDHLEAQDVLAFTGSAATGRKMRSHPRVLEKGVRVSVEADSLNAAVLGPDVEVGSDTWNLFAKEVTREMTQKAGQKCTATRRVFVPVGRLADARDSLSERLAKTTVGEPGAEGVRMGPLASAAQLEDVRSGVGDLAACGQIVFGAVERVERGDGGDADAGCFLGPILLQCDYPREAATVHHREVFGPVATLMPYDGTADDAAQLVALSEGSLVSSVYSDDKDFVRELVLGIAPYNGRVYLGSADIASEAWGPGSVLPGLVHGGPGRAGGGEELGGLRGVHHYMQRTALEGSADLIDAIIPSA